MFPLLGYLKKLISLQNTIDQLVSYAFSPRMRHLLCDRQMRVVGLPNPNQQLRLPAARAWRDVAEKALKNQGEHLKSAEPGHTIRKQYGNKSVHAGIHCECLLALHFVQSFPGGTWVFLPHERHTFQGVLPLGVAAHEEHNDIPKGGGNHILVPRRTGSFVCQGGTACPPKGKV